MLRCSTGYAERLRRVILGTAEFFQRLRRPPGAVTGDSINAYLVTVQTLREALVRHMG